VEVSAEITLVSPPTTAGYASSSPLEVDGVTCSASAIARFVRSGTAVPTSRGAPKSARLPVRGASVATRLPAQDLERARRWYREKLGLEPAEERPGGLWYRLGPTSFVLFESTGRPSGDHTQMAFDVADIEGAVTELRRRGVEFEDVDTPGLRTIGGIADIAGNYPSKGTGERGAWFRDSEGNLLGIGQSVR
jgi:catechol 2,3-dioxygenase-like lactoylglutathione lyase family enzyme